MWSVFAGLLTDHPFRPISRTRSRRGGHPGWSRVHGQATVASSLTWTDTRLNCAGGGSDTSSATTKERSRSATRTARSSRSGWSRSHARNGPLLSSLPRLVAVASPKPSWVEAHRTDVDGHAAPTRAPPLVGLRETVINLRAEPLSSVGRWTVVRRVWHPCWIAPPRRSSATGAAPTFWWRRLPLNEDRKRWKSGSPSGRASAVRAWPACQWDSADSMAISPPRVVTGLRSSGWPLRHRRPCSVPP